ncbi:MAG: recombinase family protein [Firmicutes bacterium]|nr:recombinase family protein [Bacillota bacterium]
MSTDSSDQLNSFKNQKAHYEKFIPEHPNWEYVGLYSDEGISGTSMHNRVGFQHMVEDCQAGKIELIVIKEVSRFARNTADCLNTVQMLLTLDPPVGIYFENNNLNTLDVGNKIILTMFAMFAELESELKSRSVEFGLNECYERGDYLCPTKNLLGYTKDVKYGMKIEPEGAKTVRLIYDLFLAGYSQEEIAETLTALSLPTAKGNLTWSKEGVSGILRNERYSGAIIMQKTYTISFLSHKSRRNVGQRRIFYEPVHHEGIVSIDEHARSLLLLNANHASPYFNHLYEVKVIRHGLIAGFIPLNPAFGGYDAGHYLGAFVMARVPEMDIETEVAYITGAKRVRSELFSNRNSAAVTVSGHGVAFSAGCVALMKETAYVELLLHPAERLLAIRKTTRRNKNAVPWNTDDIPAQQLSQVLYELMGWQKHWRYKMTANYFEKNDEQIIIFDLNCCEFRIRSGKKGEKTAKGFPSEWLSEFGDGTPEYMLLCRRAMANKLDSWKIGASPSTVEVYSIGVKTLTRAEAEQRIAEMRREHG